MVKVTYKLANKIIAIFVDEGNISKTEVNKISPVKCTRNQNGDDLYMFPSIRGYPPFFAKTPGQKLTIISEPI